MTWFVLLWGGKRKIYAMGRGADCVTTSAFQPPVNYGAVKVSCVYRQHTADHHLLYILLVYTINFESIKLFFRFSFFLVPMQMLLLLLPSLAQLGLTVKPIREYNNDGD
jgi:hypothetical protein